MTSSVSPRRTPLLVTTAVVTALAVTACSSSDPEPTATPPSSSSPTSSSAQCTPTPAAATGSVDGWLGILAAHRDTVSLRLVDGRGGVVEHRPDAAQQSASTIKAFVLAAYADAVHQGRLDPKEKVPVSAWERYYYPADGGAHKQALERLEIDARDVGGSSVAVDQKATVTLDDLVSTMIRESDDAAADFVRGRIGAAEVDRVVAGLGAGHTKVVSLLGTLIAATHPDLAGTDTEELARRYGDDEAFARKVLAPPIAPYAQQGEYLAAHGPRTSAADLASLYTRIGDGSLPGVEVARRHLEWQPAGDGMSTGFKAGSFPGMVGIGLERRRGDAAASDAGIAGVAALLVQGLDEATATAAAGSDPSWQKLLLTALDDPAVAHRLSCALADG